MEGETLILTHTWTEFWTEDVCKYRDLDDDLDVRFEHLTWEQLPDFVFGGRPGRGRRGQGGRA